VLAQPGHERPRGLQLGAYGLAAALVVQPGLQRVAGEHREVLQAQPLPARMVDRIAARRAFELRLDERQAGRGGLRDGALEGGSTAAVVDRRAEALELVGGGMVQPGADQQPVEP